jgi:hypothetical protein
MQQPVGFALQGALGIEQRAVVLLAGIIDPLFDIARQLAEVADPACDPIVGDCRHTAGALAKLLNAGGDAFALQVLHELHHYALVERWLVMPHYEARVARLLRPRFDVCEDRAHSQVTPLRMSAIVRLATP